MANLAAPASFEKQQPVAPRIFDLELSSRLPCRLSELPPHAHARMGPALDGKRVRLLLGDDGRVLVARARP
jgi:hypothetical protein